MRLTILSLDGLAFSRWKRLDSLALSNITTITKVEAIDVPLDALQPNTSEKGPFIDYPPAAENAEHKPVTDGLSAHMPHVSTVYVPGSFFKSLSKDIRPLGIREALPSWSPPSIGSAVICR